MEKKKSSAIAVKAGLALILAAGLALRLWYGSFGLRLDRFEDEQHSWPNVQSILQTGSLAPPKSYYPYPLFNLPPAALIAIGDRLDTSQSKETSAISTPKGSVPPRDLFLCRLWPILYGTLAIFLTFLVGRRVFSESAGLIGALLLAFSPQAIHSSGYFKPDSQLLCMALLALLLALRAVERPNIGRYALAGLGVTLTASSKAIGLGIAVPLVVASLITARRRHRDLLLLGVAGVTSALSFAAMNPYWRIYPKWLASLRYLYAVQARAKGETQLSLPWRTLEFLLQPIVQNTLLTALGLVGLIGLVAWLWRNRGHDTRWLYRLMFLSFPVAYVTAYSLTTAYLKGNNFLVLLPFPFLAAGWVLATVWTRANESWGFLSRPIYSSLAAAGLLFLAAGPGLSYTYCALVPTTSFLAKYHLSQQAKPPDGRVVILENPQLARPGWEGWPRQLARDRLAFRQVDSVQELSLETLELTDGLAVASTSIERSEELSRWLDGLPHEQVRIFEPELFRARGPVTTAAHQRIPRLEAPRALEVRPCPGRPHCLAAEIPADLSPGETDSLILYVKQSHFDRHGVLPDIRLGGRRVDLTWASWVRRAKRHHFISSRIDLHGEELSVVIESAEGRRLRPADFRVELCRWQRPGSP